MTLTPPTESRRPRRRQRRDPDPHFKPDTSHQIDAILGCPAESVPQGHLAWAVLEIVEQLDTSSIEAGYSSLGRNGYHPKSTLAVWVYASLIGLHHSTKVARALETDAAMRLVARGGKHSGATLRRFRQGNTALFAAAIDATLRLARQRGLLDEKDLAVDSVRLRAHASTKAVQTRERSTKRLGELAALDPAKLPEAKRTEHAAKVKKHEEALALCEQRGTTSVVLTNPSAALMKFPTGAGLPGHRVTVTAAGQKERFIVAVLVDAATNDYGKLGDAVRAAREAVLATWSIRSFQRERVGPRPPQPVRSWPQEQACFVGGLAALLEHVDGLLCLLRRLWSGWAESLAIVRPDTVVRWHRAGFRIYWNWLSKRGYRSGRPPFPLEVRALVRRMATENSWGAPRIHGELLCLGFEVSERSVSRYLLTLPRTPRANPTWTTFLRNHRDGIAAMDFFSVPTAMFRVLHVFLVVHHCRRDVIRCAVTASPTAAWVAQQ